MTTETPGARRRARSPTVGAARPTGALAGGDRRGTGSPVLITLWNEWHEGSEIDLRSSWGPAPRRHGGVLASVPCRAQVIQQPASQKANSRSRIRSAVKSYFIAFRWAEEVWLFLVPSCRPAVVRQGIVGNSPVYGRKWDLRELTIFVSEIGLDISRKPLQHSSRDRWNRRVWRAGRAAPKKGHMSLEVSAFHNVPQFLQAIIFDPQTGQ